MILTNLVYNGDNKNIHSGQNDVVFMQKIMTTTKKGFLGLSNYKEVSFYASGLKYYTGQKIEDIQKEMKEITNKFSDPLKIMKEIEGKYAEKQKEMRENNNKSNSEFDESKENKNPPWPPTGYKKYKLARCNQGVATTLGIIGIDTYTGEEEYDGGNVTKDPKDGTQINANKMIEYLSQDKNFKSLYNIIGEEGFEQLSKLCKTNGGGNEEKEKELAYEYLTKVMDFIYKLGYIGVGTMYNNDKKGGSGHVFMLFGNQSGDVNFRPENKYDTVPLYVSMMGITNSKEVISKIFNDYKNIINQILLYNKNINNQNKDQNEIDPPGCSDEEKVYIYNFYYYNIPVYMTYDYGFTACPWNN